MRRQGRSRAFASNHASRSGTSREAGVFRVPDCVTLARGMERILLGDAKKFQDAGGGLGAFRRSRVAGARANGVDDVSERAYKGSRCCRSSNRLPARGAPRGLVGFGVLL